MSSPPSNELRTVLTDAEPVEAVGQSLLRQIRGVAFWTAVTLPFLYVPLLATGLETTSQLTAFLALLLCNALALLIGHSHLQD